MVPLLLLPLLWGGSLQEERGFKLSVQESVTVQEGLCILVPCSFSYPGSLWPYLSPLYIYWYRNGDYVLNADLVATNNPQKTVKRETRGRFQLHEDPRTNCSLSIKDARKSDTGLYFFRVEAGSSLKYSYRDRKLSLRVTDLTEKPDIQVPERLESGRPARLTCSLPGACEGGRSFTFSWVGAALESLSPQALRSSELTITPKPWDHGTNLTCQVTRQGVLVTVERTIWLNVSYAPQTLTIGIFFRNVTEMKCVGNGSSVPVLEGDSVRLVCVAESNPPATLSWAQGSRTLSPSPPSDPGVLELPQIQREHEGEFTCQAEHPRGSLHVSLHLSVHYPPQLLGPSCSWEDEGLHCSCSSRAQPAPSLRWRQGERLLEGNFSNASIVATSSSAGPWANSSLSLSRGLGPGLRLKCEAWNAHGAQSAAVLLLPGKLVPQMGVVSGALGGAGATALLSLCVCLLFFCIVKARRRKAAREPKGMDDEDPVMGAVSWGSKQKPQAGSPPDQASPAREAPPLGEQQELHYANLSFHGIKLRDPWDLEATSTIEYSEINTKK